MEPEGYKGGPPGPAHTRPLFTINVLAGRANKKDSFVCGKGERGADPCGVTGVWGLVWRVNNFQNNQSLISVSFHEARSDLAHS